jgi:hypothetical protein
MKRTSYLISLLLAVGPGPAWALNCAATAGYAQQDPANLIGQTACYPATGPYRNQEFLTGGNIIDYKKGPTDKVDPTKTVGAYFNNENSLTMTYTYISGSTPYTYTIWGPTAANTYDFCLNGTTPLPGGVRVVSGQVPCSGPAP